MINKIKDLYEMKPRPKSFDGVFIVFDRDGRPIDWPECVEEVFFTEDESRQYWAKKYGKKLVGEPGKLEFESEEDEEEYQQGTSFVGPDETK